MGTAAMLQKYPSPQMIKQMIDGRMPLPEDKQTRAAVMTSIARYKRKKAADDEAKANADQPAGPTVAQATIGNVQSTLMNPPVPPPPTPGGARLTAEMLNALPLDADQKSDLLNGTQETRLALLESLPDDKLVEVLEALPPQVRNRLANAGPPSLRRRVEILNTPQQVVNRDLSEGKLLRAIYSNRQLEEVLYRFLVQPLQRLPR